MGSGGRRFKSPRPDQECPGFWPASLLFISMSSGVPCAKSVPQVKVSGMDLPEAPSSPLQQVRKIIDADPGSPEDLRRRSRCQRARMNRHDDLAARAGRMHENGMVARLAVEHKAGADQGLNQPSPVDVTG